MFQKQNATQTAQAQELTFILVTVIFFPHKYFMLIFESVENALLKKERKSKFAFQGSFYLIKEQLEEGLNLSQYHIFFFPLQLIPR